MHITTRTSNPTHFLLPWTAVAMGNVCLTPAPMQRGFGGGCGPRLPPSAIPGRNPPVTMSSLAHTGAETQRSVHWQNTALLASPCTSPTCWQLVCLNAGTQNLVQAQLRHLDPASWRPCSVGSRGNGSEALQERGLVPAQPQFTALPTDLGRGHAHGVRRQWAPHCPSPANWLSFATVPAHQCSLSLPWVCLGP